MSLKQKLEYSNMEYNRMALTWPLPKTLRGGTPAMRAAGETYLPKEEKEQPKQYEARLKRSFLFSAYDDTVVKLVAKPFSEPVTVEGEPSQLADIKDNVDGAGRDLTQFARELFDKAVGDFGLCHVLVEFPKQQTDAEGDAVQRTALDDIVNPIRPYFVAITPEMLVDWEYGQDNNGMPVLLWIKIKLERIERDPDTQKETKKCRYYYYKRNTWELFEKNKDGEYFEVASGSHSYDDGSGGGIPLVTYYVNRDGQLTGTPPLDRLAQINLAHWQSMSDQRNILRYSRFAILHAKGFSKEEIDDKLTVGGNVMLRSKSTEAALTYVEHTGKAIQAGENDLKALEERMEVLGLQPFMSNIGNVKATGQAINESKQQSSIKAWIRSLENALIECYRVAARWLSVEIPDSMTIDIYNEFSLGLKASDDIKALIEMRKAVPPMIDHDTFITEVKRRGILSEDVDAAKMLDNVTSEAPPSATMTNKPDDDEEDDDESEEDE